MPAPFIRAARDSTDRELVVGTWGLIPWFAKNSTVNYSTNNARREELAAKARFKLPWKHGQRCIIPAPSLDEPAAMVAGGALGNAYDRVFFGAVVDFINMSCCGVKSPYSFNVADAWIVGGAMLMTGGATTWKAGGEVRVVVPASAVCIA